MISFRQRQVLVGFVRRRHIGLADNLDQRHARAIQIDARLLTRVGEAFVQALARIFFQMDPRNPDLLAAILLEVDRAKLRQRLVVLGNLVALGKVGIEIVLAGKNRSLVDAAIQCHRRQHSELHRLPVHHRQDAGHPQAHGTNITIGRSSKFRRARAKYFRRRQELDVNFQPNHRLVLGMGGNGRVRRGRHR